MKRLYVFADFDWLKAPRLIGELSYESLRGSDSYGFCYSDDWLRDYGNLFLSDDLNNYPGQQYTAPSKDIFGCFFDALPDRWGRTLINVGNRFWRKRRSALSAVFHPLTILSESKTTPAWVVSVLRTPWTENISIQVKFYRFRQ